MRLLLVLCLISTALPAQHSGVFRYELHLSNDRAGTKVVIVPVRGSHVTSGEKQNLALETGSRKPVNRRILAGAWKFKLQPPFCPGEPQEAELKATVNVDVNSSDSTPAPFAVKYCDPAPGSGGMARRLRGRPFPGTRFRLLLAAFSSGDRPPQSGSDGGSLCRGSTVPGDKAICVAATRGADATLIGVPEQGGDPIDIDSCRLGEGSCALDLTKIGDRKFGSFVVAVEKDGYDSQLIPVRPESIQIPVNLVREKADGQPHAEPAVTVPLEGMLRYVFSSQLLDELPLQIPRSFDSVALLLPGIYPAPQTPQLFGPSISPGVGTAGQLSANGIRSRENNFTIDGSDNNDELLGVRRQGFVALAPQALETVQEMQVITAAPDARFGRNIGGQVNMLTQFITKSWHGEAHTFFANGALRARDFFESRPSAGQFVDPSVLVDGAPARLTPFGEVAQAGALQPGLSIGGRVPQSFHTGTHVFASVETQSVHADSQQHFAVPVARERGIGNSGDRGLRLTEPITGLDRNVYPATLAGNAIFSLYPFPNNPGGPYGANTFTENLSADRTSRLLTLKADQPFSFGGRRQILIARYNRTGETSTLPSTGGALNSSLQPRLRTQNLAVLASLDLWRRMSNTFRGSWGDTRAHFDEVSGNRMLPSALVPDTPFLLNAPLLLNVTRPGANLANYVSADSPQGRSIIEKAIAQLPGPPYSSRYTSETFTGLAGQVDIAGFSPVGVDVYRFPQERKHYSFQLADAATIVAGAHIFSTGFEMRRYYLNSTAERNARPLISFHGLEPFSRSGPSSSSATLAAAGLPAGLFHTLVAGPSLAESLSDPLAKTRPEFPLRLRKTHVDLLAQDEWRIRPNFNLTYGFRFQISRLPKDADDRLSRAFDRTELERQAGATAAQLQSLGACGGAFDPGATCAPLTSVVKNLPDFGGAFGAEAYNFDARLGFAWNVRPSGATVLRAAWASIHGQFPGIIVEESRSSFPDFLPVNLANLPDWGYLYSSTGDPRVRNRVVLPQSLNLTRTSGTADAIQLLALNLRSADSEPLLNLLLPQSGLANPRSRHTVAAVEQKLPWNSVLSVAYVGTTARRLLRVITPDGGFYRGSIDVRRPVPTGDFPAINASLRSSQPPAGAPFSVARMLMDSTASSRYDSAQLHWRKQSGPVRFGAQYTLGHCTDDSSDLFDLSGVFALPQNSVRPSERGDCAFDMRHRSASYFVWDFWRGKRKWTGDWQLSGTWIVNSGPPFTVNSTVDVNQDGNLTDRLDRADGLLLHPAGADRRTTLVLNASAATLVAAAGSDGAVGRNTFRAGGMNNVDLALRQTVKLGEMRRFQLGLELYNVANRAQFAIPVRMLEAPGFGAAVRTVAAPRLAQVAIRLLF